MPDDDQQIVMDESVTSDDFAVEPSDTEDDPAPDEKPSEEADGDKEETAASDEDEDDGEAEEADAEEDGDGAAAEKPKRKGGFQKRIDELTRKQKQAEREAEVLRQQLQQAQQHLQQPESAQDTAAPPKPEDFDDESEYIVARTKYEVRQELDAERKQTAEAIRQQTAQQRQAQFMARAELAKAKYDDFESVALNSTVPINQSMAEALFDSELGPDIAYYLGNHPDEAREIASLSPLSAARHIGAIEARLSQPVEAAPRKVTKASPPPRTLKGSSTADKPSLEEVSYEEFKRRRMGGKSR